MTKPKRPIAGDRLSPREIEVLQCTANGFTEREIARTLGLSFRTIATHKYRIHQKLETSNAAEACVRAIREGIIK